MFYEKIGENKILYYFYDSYGKLADIYYTYQNGTYVSSARYHVATNAQGDVIALYNSNGVKVGAYDYDAWGNQRVFVVTQDSSGANVHTQINPETQYLTHIVNLNPIRYRGYYFDRDLGLYYLQSRYYDSDVGRFINTDNITDSGAGILGYNTFMYCGNNPINAADPTGHGIIKDAIKRFASFVQEKVNTYKTKSKDNVGTVQLGATISGSVVMQGIAAWGVTFDRQGNVGVFFSSGGGTGSPSLSACSLITITEAPTIDYLNGPSFQIGGSVDVKGVSVGAEYTGMMDSKGEVYSGLTATAGVGFVFPSPGEIHMDITRTRVEGVNVFDEIDDVCTKIMEW